MAIDDRLPLQDYLKRGEWVEMQFVARATQHGLIVSKPWGNSTRYDFVVDHKSRLTRVQVKSTSCYIPSVKGYAGYRACLKTSRNSEQIGKKKSFAYTPADADFFAIYIVPENLWYVMPLTEAGKGGVLLYPYMQGSRGLKYLEAWHLLKNG